MKNIFTIIALGFVLMSCNNQKQNEQTETVTTQSDSALTKPLTFSKYFSEFNKADSLVGEVLPASVTGFNSEPIENKRIGDDLYIVSMNEKFAEVIFLKKLTNNQVMLDQASTITWSPIELKEV